MPSRADMRAVTLERSPNYERKTNAQQLGAQVWPYVTFTGTTEADRLELDVANDGLGPALVKSFVLRVDGKPQHDLLAALHLLVGHVEPEHRAGERTKAVLGFIASGQVLRPSSSQPVVRIEGNHTG